MPAKSVRFRMFGTYRRTGDGRIVALGKTRPESEFDALRINYIECDGDKDILYLAVGTYWMHGHRKVRDKPERLPNSG